MSSTIQVKRIYDPPAKSDGYRVLVDRLWPRGMKKEAADIDEWAKDLAPSTDLRKWFGHEPRLWSDFEKRYMDELKANDAVKTFAKAHGGENTITLLYAAKDEEHNHALVLKKYLATKLKSVK
ncbi:DUF488 domain-containing protein [Puia sp. P3]|uniref:DUF488 domain-containing protein n=1 Tax=Puia sp. P3 TaxID=3423952 RepID=UPI003D672062